MIYYFSGTGNSKWVAEKIATNIDDKAINIMDMDRNKSIHIGKNETVGFVYPIYAWTAAEVMTKFINNFSKEQGSYVFAVCTCYSEAGNSFKHIDKVLNPQCEYSISMPNNYILGSNVNSEDEVKDKIKKAEKIIEEISKQIKDKKTVKKIEKGPMPFFKTTIISPAFNKFARNTKPFYAEDSCISCGLCESNCPTKCIKLVEGKPQWGKECYQCLSCINRCPKQAIQYGHKTKARGRYFFKEQL